VKRLQVFGEVVCPYESENMFLEAIQESGLWKTLIGVSLWCGSPLQLGRLSRDDRALSGGARCRIRGRHDQKRAYSTVLLVLIGFLASRRRPSRCRSMRCGFYGERPSRHCAGRRRRSSWSRARGIRRRRTSMARNMCSLPCAKRSSQISM
jgi:hypothetical protein